MESILEERRLDIARQRLEIAISNFSNVHSVLSQLVSLSETLQCDELTLSIDVDRLRQLVADAEAEMQDANQSLTDIVSGSECDDEEIDEEIDDEIDNEEEIDSKDMLIDMLMTA
jgi:hypothetical protein